MVPQMSLWSEKPSSSLWIWLKRDPGCHAPRPLLSMGFWLYSWTVRSRSSEESKIFEFKLPSVSGNSMGEVDKALPTHWQQNDARRKMLAFRRIDESSGKVLKSGRVISTNRSAKAVAEPVSHRLAKRHPSAYPCHTRLELHCLSVPHML